MVPVVGNAADGINAAWYATEGEYLDAALSSIALIPGIGQAATLAKGTIKAAADGIVFRNLDEALQWAKRWLEEAGILRRSGDDGLDAGLSGRGLQPAPGTRVIPTGIPDNWRIVPTTGDGSVRYFDPENAGNSVRVMQGSPTSPHVNSQTP